MNNRDSLRERHTSIHSNDQLSTLTSSNLLVCLFTSPPDGPQRPSVSVSPSAEMLEGDSVTLTCSTDANPAANYTWYKQGGTSDPRLLSEEPQLVFSSIQSSDSGRYFCTAENQLGRKTSDFISIDVKYGPQRPSVSVSPSAEMLEGDSVTLTCSADANPAASYTWYKEHEDSPRASGQIFTITNFTAEHSGNYYCEAQNEMGRSNSTIRLIPSSVIQSQDGWRVIYYPTYVCAAKGSTVDISSFYTHPPRIRSSDIKDRFWFTKEKDGEPVDLRTDSEYSDRVTYGCYSNSKDCYLTITDVRESDSAEYKFRFMTEKMGGKYTGSPGVTLSVTGLQVQVRRLNSTWLELTCHSSCVLSDRPKYVWYKNEEIIKTGSSLPVSSASTDRYSCYLRGSCGHGSPAVYGPQRPSVSVSPSAEMLEGDSVTLTCSTDANPAANYTWYKAHRTSDPHLLSKEPHLVFSSIQSSDSGRYFCTAENQLGRKTSDFISIDVKYGPQRPSVSVSPSAEMLEGDSVTLTCSTDANPAASYTWYKEHEDSPRASGQIFTITDFTAEHSGNYYCEAQNEMGRSNSTLRLIPSSEKGGSTWSTTTTVFASISAVFLLIIILAVLYIR
uniref:Ig-like domain-containing protein n=1 Tax=Gasterosteus aculeatus aculeatus TaxID=481459 RepID=A0AAQ4NZ46_GASAC